MGGFLLIAVGRVLDMVPALGNLPLGKVMMAIVLLGAFANWKKLPRISSEALPVLRTGAWLMVLVVLSVPFSVWPGPSVDFVMGILPILLCVVLVTVKLSTSWTSLQRLISATIASGVIMAVFLLFATSGERLGFGASLSYDPNDIAYALDVVLPMLVARIYLSNGWKRLGSIALAVLLAATTLLTSSRGGFLGLIAVVLVIALRPLPMNGTEDAARVQLLAKRDSPRLGRALAIMLALGAIGAASWQLLPQETRERLGTIMDLESDYNADSTVTRGRSQIWERGFDAIGRRPWGHGVAAYEMVDLRQGGVMLTAHNTILQITVELGVLGGLLFLRMYWLLWRGLSRAQRDVMGGAQLSFGDYSKLVYCRMLQASLAGAFVSSFFLSMAYSILLWLAFALAAGCMQQVPVRRGED
jgi:O-antigen ligase